MKLRGTKRREFPQSVRKASFARCCRDGVPHCENVGCGRQITKQTRMVYEHLLPDGLGGEPTLENCAVFCGFCADKKTVEQDNPRMAKADRVFKRENGLEPTKKPFASRGFLKAKAQRSASRPIARKARLHLISSSNQIGRGE